MIYVRCDEVNACLAIGLQDAVSSPRPVVVSCCVIRSDVSSAVAVGRSAVSVAVSVVVSAARSGVSVMPEHKPR